MFRTILVNFIFLIVFFSFIDQEFYTMYTEDQWLLQPAKRNVLVRYCNSGCSSATKHASSLNFLCYVLLNNVCDFKIITNKILFLNSFDCGIYVIKYLEATALNNTTLWMNKQNYSVSLMDLISDIYIAAVSITSNFTVF